MKRKILSVLLALCMLLALMATPIAAAYQDTEGHWAESSIERWTGHGIVQGTENGFDPDGELTCAQLAAILARLLKLPEAPDAGFSDNPAEAWYYDSVNRCAAAGILLGNGDGTVTPNAPITRERAIVMLSRALGIEPVENPDLSAFEDADAVADYAQGYVAALVAAGVIKGVTDETVGPQLNITRAATVAILDRAIAVYADTDGAEIDASEGGFILVAAENVAIKNAPAGTKVLVTPSADDLTVNGKKVESDQTYVVPENKPVTPVHSHSYDETTHKCYCGSFDPAVVATIGDEVGYLTLKDAVAAAQSGDTVKLVKDIVISPAVSDEDKTVSKLVAQLTVDTDVVLDMNGKKLSVTEGDFGKASPLLIAVTAGTLTIKGNGEINCEAGEDQVYGINVNGGKVVVEDGTFYGAMTAIQVQKGELVIKDGTFDMAPTCKAMVPQYAKYIVNAIDSAWKNGTAKISIFGGTFGFDPSNTPEGAESTYLADGYQATETAEGSGFWTVTEAKNASFAAEVGGVKYTTLAKAIAAAAAGDTVTLVGDVTEDVTVSAGKTVTIDLGGKKLTNVSSDTIIVENGATLTITGTGTVDNVTHGKAAIYNNGTVTLNGGSYTRSEEKGEDKNNSGGNSYYNILNHGIMTIEETVSVTSSGHFSSLIASGYYNFSDTANPRNGYVSGTNHESPSLTINGGTFSGGINTIKNDDNAQLIINGGSFSNVTQAVVQNNHVAEIHGGSFNADGYHVIENRHYDGGHNAGSVTVTSGTFTGGLYTTTGATWSITGGTFSSDPSAYVAAGYEATEDNGTWTVGEKTGVTLVAQVGLNKYESLADALAAAKDGDTVKLVDDMTLAERVNVAFTGTIDLDGHTISSTATCANGSVFNVTSGTVTIKNGSIVGVAGPTGWTEELYEMECDAITVCSGAIVNLEELNISICSRTGACVYAFDGGIANVKSGTYSNKTTEFDANGTTKAMLLNQADGKSQAIFVTGGQFHGENPANGDNSGNPSTFLAEGYTVVDENGVHTVRSN